MPITSFRHFFAIARGLDITTNPREHTKALAHQARVYHRRAELQLVLVSRHVLIGVHAFES